MPTINRLSVQNKPINLRKSTGPMPIFNSLDFPISKAVENVTPPPPPAQIQKPKMKGSIATNI